MFHVCTFSAICSTGEGRSSSRPLGKRGNQQLPFCSQFNNNVDERSAELPLSSACHYPTQTNSFFCTRRFLAKYAQYCFHCPLYIKCSDYQQKYIRCVTLCPDEPKQGCTVVVREKLTKKMTKKIGNYRCDFSHNMMPQPAHLFSTRDLFDAKGHSCRWKGDFVLKVLLFLFFFSEGM